ncbi:MAG: carboxypeptidase-like regulatory domain-containing protein [Chitinophagaceae bacterium]|nr:carboxypeptidase-like regulatory domain-containing protein [Chitinophagaceae bacterium]
MSGNNNIHAFTAADIEKYHKGLLSPKEMQAMEKAALDDPFLADALEGYAVEGVNVNADIAELKRRLAEKTEQAKVIPLQGSTRSSFRWLRAAAVILFIAGAGLLSYQFLFKTKNTDIAQKPQKETPKDTGTANTQPQANNSDTPGVIEPNVVTVTTGATASDQTTETSKQQTFIKTDSDAGREATTIPSEKKELAKSTDAKPVPVTGDVSSQAKDADKLEEKAIATTTKPTGSISDNKKDITASADTRQADVLSRRKAETEADKKDDKQLNETAVTARGITNAKQNSQGYISNMNYFRGKVTDANNNPLPFTNVINTVDNVGTYSDAKGNFTLVSTDSMMDVQLRSLGFENGRIRLRSDLSTNQIVLQEDRGLNARVLDTVKRDFAARSREGNMTLEEPEPVDGWKPYGSYLANNLNVPESFERKKNADDNIVELSFEVNKYGDPINIKVERSLCDKCDQEAIRLVKEGPKWKRKAKKNKRTTVRVPFIKPSDW